MVCLGEWSKTPEKYGATFREGAPFEHVVIPNFFDEKDAERIYQAFPKVDDKWNHYDNPIEQKYSLNNFSDNEVVKQVFELLQSQKTLE